MHPQEYIEVKAGSIATSGDDDALMTSAQVCQLVGGITLMCLWRWMRDDRVRFPAPDVVINRVRYWYRATVRRWQAERAAASVSTNGRAEKRAA